MQVKVTQTKTIAEKFLPSILTAKQRITDVYEEFSALSCRVRKNINASPFKIS
jgi:hypothetical protein